MKSLNNIICWKTREQAYRYLGHRMEKDFLKLWEEKIVRNDIIIGLKDYIGSQR